MADFPIVDNYISLTWARQKYDLYWPVEAGVYGLATKGRHTGDNTDGFPEDAHLVTIYDNNLS